MRRLPIPLLALVCGCHPLSQIVLDVDTDLMVPGEIDAVAVEIVSGAQSIHPPTIDLLARGAPAFPLTLGMTAPTAGAELSVTATASRSNREIVRQTSLTDFIDGKSLLLRLLLSSSCSQFSCPEDQTCADGVCQGIHRPGLSLPEWTGVPPPRPPTRSMLMPVGGRSVWAAGNQSCAVDGSLLFCWGQNTDGQLGIGTNQNAVTRQRVLGLDAPSAIGLGLSHSCACDVTGQAFCWGRNADGQLGTGTTTATSRPLAVPGVTDCAEITGGGQHTCVLHKTGAISCWGSNAKGQLGQTAPISPAPVTQPRLVPGLNDALSVQAGDRSTCALRADATVWCWGDNSSGQLGDGTTRDRSSPAPVTGLPADVVELAVSRLFACVRLGSGHLRCWGDNGSGQLGNGATVASSAPVEVNGVADAVQIAAGGSQHVCAIRKSGVASCWGGNAFGQFGDGDVAGSLVPVDVVGISDVVSLAAGSGHTCARRASGLPCLCWGHNDVNQLGEGTTTDRTTPVSVYGFPP